MVESCGAASSNCANHYELLGAKVQTWLIKSSQDGVARVTVQDFFELTKRDDPD